MLTKETIRKMMHSIKMTHQHEITCGECFSEVDRYAEMELSGMNPSEAMPMVKKHLDLCGNCREEYEALLGALKAMVD